MARLAIGGAGPSLPSMALKVGAQAPDIEAPTSTGETFRLREHAGKYVVVYFFPRAFTPTCTVETTRFGESAQAFRDRGATVIGISTDSHETQCAFGSSTGSNLPLIADPDQHISKAYGVLWPLVGLARRVTFLIGPDRHIRHVVWNEFSVGRHLDGMLDALPETT